VLFVVAAAVAVVVAAVAAVVAAVTVAGCGFLWLTTCDDM